MFEAVFLQGRNGKELQARVKEHLNNAGIRREHIVSISHATESVASLKHNAYIVYEK